MRGKAYKGTFCKPAQSGCRETKTNKRDKRQKNGAYFFT
nr:MAG TPA: hypothetical protein [Ackermannviridae sp.]